MIKHRTTARIVGILYIIGTVAAFLSIVFTQPILESSDYLVKVTQHQNQIITGSPFVRDYNYKFKDQIEKISQFEFTPIGGFIWGF